MRKRLSEHIEKTSIAMRGFLQETPPSYNFTPLRELSTYCSKRLFKSEDGEERFMCFFLYSFIDSIFSNLGGDIEYDEQLQKIREMFYKKLADILYELGCVINEGNKEKIVNTLILSIDEYVNNINMLNESL